MHVHNVTISVKYVEKKSEILGYVAKTVKSYTSENNILLIFRGRSRGAQLQLVSNVYYYVYSNHIKENITDISFVASGVSV